MRARWIVVAAFVLAGTVTLVYFSKRDVSELGTPGSPALSEAPQAPIAASSVAQAPLPFPSPDASTPPNFESTLSQALATLPTTEKLRDLRDSDVHGMPEPVRAAGDALANIADSVAKNRALAPRALQFYAECVDKKDVVASVRALCLSNVRKWSQRLEMRTPVDESQVPPHIVRLADQLP
jgi:hypothetical protein